MNRNFIRTFSSLILGLTIISAGTSSVQAADGSLDPTFGNGGIVTTDFGDTVDFGNSATLQPDGKIVMAGYAGPELHFTVARYNADGTLDDTFDGDGWVQANIGNPYKGGIADVLLQPDGKILVGGQSFNGSNHDFALLRYNSDGSPDASFDVDGQVTTDFAGDEDYCYAIALQPDGKLLAAGRSLKAGNFDFALARYNSDGSPDTSFGTGGKMITDFAASDDWGMDVALQPDGKIVLIGTSNEDFAVARYNPNGTPDATFGTAGKVTTDFGGSEGSSAVVIQADGRIVVAGTAHRLTADIALTRYNPDGSLDNTFGVNGKVTTDLAENNDFGAAIALQPDGKVLVAGQTGQGNTMPEIAFALARYNSDGSLDTTLNSMGWLSTSIGGIQDQATDMVLQPDGKAVVVGVSANGANVDFALVRYNLGSEASYVTLVVPGTANPWLAGMPDGTLSHFGDSAPANSPVEVTGVPITPGASLSFSAAGVVRHGPSSDPLIEASGPDGGQTILSHDFGPEHGVSDITAPINALLGIFLGPDQPDQFPPPDALDFSTPESRDYASLSPQLQQVFFIGDGFTSQGEAQHILVPAGATRLFLGPMDASQFNNNEGAFTVQVSTKSLPSVTIDIKPNSQTNRINASSRGKVRVAILSSADFDALNLLDRSSLRFGHSGLEESLVSCRKRGTDVNGDGLLDLVCLYSIQEAGFRKGDVTGILTGQTLDGNPILGNDFVKIVRAVQ
jgi:uncharacterized delta-60 repeat protein